MDNKTNKLSWSELVGQAGPLSVREALTRFFGVSILVMVGYLHLMDISHKIQEGVWYMAFLFAALIVSSVVLAVALVRADESRVRFIWVSAAALAAGAMFGYFISRALPLPGMADHQGDWLNSTGVFAGLFELGLVTLAAFALRDRVLRRQASQRARRRRQLVAPALSMLGLFGLQPAVALAHNGEEMTEEEMAAAEMGHEPGAMDHEGMSGISNDPLLGGTELGLILVLALGFVTWAGFALRARASGTDRSRRRRPERAKARPREVPAALTPEPVPVTEPPPVARPRRVSPLARAEPSYAKSEHPTANEPPTVPLKAERRRSRGARHSGGFQPAYVLAISP